MEILGNNLFDLDDFLKLVFKFLINLTFLFITIRLIFYKNNRDKDYLFTFFMFNLLTFFICVILRKVPMEMGFAMGLFAVFGILRYRTEALPIKEMTYLFIVIGISVMNALVNKKISHAEVIFTNVMFIAITYGLEKIWLLKHESRKNITFEKIELILPERKEELLADLKERTGLNITRVEIRNVDFLRDTANLRIFYFEDEQK